MRQQTRKKQLTKSRSTRDIGQKERIDKKICNKQKETKDKKRDDRQKRPKYKQN